MPPAIPHLLAFYNPSLTNEVPDFRHRQPMASRNNVSLQLSPFPCEQHPLDPDDDDQEFSVFYCTCGSSCKVMEFLPPDGERVQAFLSSVKDCDCELSPNEIRYISAPLTVSKIPLSTNGQAATQQVTSDSYSEIENSDSGSYDMTRKRLIQGEQSQGYTIKLYPTKRPVIFFWSKAPGRQDIIRDVTYSASRGRTKLPKGFTANALRALVGKTQIAELLDWEPTVNKFIAGVRNIIPVTDLLYILACPFILRYNSLSRSFISGNSVRPREADVWPSLLETMAARGSEIRNSEQFYRHILPSHLQSSVSVLTGVSSEGSFYMPALYMVSQHFTDSACFSQLCRNLTLLGSSFMKNLMIMGSNQSPELSNQTLGLIAKKVDQKALTDIIGTCMSAAGNVQFRELVELVAQARKSETMWTALDEMEPSSAKTISKFLNEAQSKLISISLRRDV